MSNRIINFLLLQIKNLLLILFVGILGSMTIHKFTGGVQFFMEAEAAGSSFNNALLPQDLKIRLNPSNLSYIKSVDFLIVNSRAAQQGRIELEVDGIENRRFPCVQNMQTSRWICRTPGLDTISLRAITIQTT